MAEPKLTQIHIADNKTDEILDFIPETDFWNDERKRALTDNRDTFDFETFATESYSGALEERNRIIIPNKYDDSYSEFIIEEAAQIMDDSGLQYKAAYTTASYLELRKQKVIPAQTVLAQSPQQHVAFALEGTEWEPGDIAYAENHTTVLTAYMDAYSYLQNVASWSGMELRFRVEHNGYQVTGRYVDLVDRAGVWRGHEAVFGTNLMSIERRRKFDAVVTALIGIGPQNEDGTESMEVYVESSAALARWGRNGMHLIEVFTPQSEDQNINPAKLLSLTQEELNRRISHQSEYVATIATLADVLEVDPTDLQFGDIIRIKDEEFNPPIYLEARIHEMTESIKAYGDSTVTLGDFTEFTEDEVKSILKRLQKSLADKISNAEFVDVIAGLEDSIGDSISAEEAQRYSEIEGLIAIRRIYTTANSSLTLEYALLNDNVHLAGTTARTQLDAAMTAYGTSFATFAGLVELAITDSVFTNAERQALLDATNDLEAKQATLNQRLKAAQGIVAEAQAEAARQLAEQAVQAAADAYEDAQTALTEVVSKVDQSTYDTRVGELQAAIDASGGLTQEDVDNSLAGYVLTTTYTTGINGLITSIEQNETAITQANNAIALRATTAQFDALTQTVSDNTAAITVVSDAISLKADAETVTILEDNVAAVSAIAQTSEVRLNEVESLITPGAIIDTVTQSTSFEIMLNTKANAEDLAGYATSEALDNIMNEVDSLGSTLAGISIAEFVTQTEIAQRDLSLLTSISASSGVNLVRNSVGLAGLMYWTKTGDGDVSPTNTPDLTALGYHSGFLFDSTGTGNLTLKQDIAVVQGRPYTVSYAVRALNATGNMIVRVLNATTGAVIATSPVPTSAPLSGFENYSFTIDEMPATQITLEVIAPQGKQAIVTGLMVNIGTVAFSWTTAVGELYNTTIKMDLQGLRVSQLEDNLETGFTVMTPVKFAGYYNATGIINENTGSADEVFRMDKDEFVMKKANVKEEITMGTVKLIKIDTTARKGWAFVPNLAT